MNKTKYVLINLGDIDLVDFSKVEQHGSGKSDLRYTKDGTKFVISYVGDQPDFVFNDITHDAVGLEEYTVSEITSLLESI